eukprot:753378-Hanusia_phi.AAC.7
MARIHRLPYCLYPETPTRTRSREGPTKAFPGELCLDLSPSHGFKLVRRPTFIEPSTTFALGLSAVPSSRACRDHWGSDFNRNYIEIVIGSTYLRHAEPIACILAVLLHSA